MDRFYNCNNQSHNFVGRKVNLRKYFEEFSSKLKSDDVDNPYELLRNRGIELTEDQRADVEDACDVDRLTVKGEPLKVTEGTAVTSVPEFYPKAQVPTDHDLETFKREINRRTKKRVPLKSDYSITRIKQFFKKDLVPYEDFIVMVRIFPPSKQEPGGTVDYAKTYTQEITLWSNNKLSILKDHILCLEDYQECTGDVSELYTSKDDRIPVPQRNKVLYPSGLFYINNTFFIDRRSENHKDYSSVIMECAKKWKLGFSNDVPTSIEDVMVGDLSVRFGFPYLYQHQGNCEHLIVFSDARLVHPTDDNLCSANYPLVTNRRETCNSCMVCGLRIAEWVVKECKRFPHDITFLCNECHFMYNYIDRRKVDNFKAYRFWDRTEFLTRKDLM